MDGELTTVSLFSMKKRRKKERRETDLRSGETRFLDDVLRSEMDSEEEDEDEEKGGGRRGPGREQPERSSSLIRVARLEEPSSVGFDCDGGDDGGGSLFLGLLVVLERER